MSKLDFELQEKITLQLNEKNRSLANIDDLFLNQEEINSLNKMDIDLQDWLEIFEEDQVKLEGCR